jgi:hypothetical protein
MNIISYAQGHCLHLKGNMAWNNNPINAQRFFNMAMEKYEGAFSTQLLPLLLRQVDVHVYRSPYAL